MPGLRERLIADTPTLNAMIAERVARAVPELSESEWSLSMLEVYIDQIGQELLRAFFGESWATTPAKNVGMVERGLGRIPVHIVRRVFEVAETTVIARVYELNEEDEDLTVPLARLRIAFRTSVEAMEASYAASDASEYAADQYFS